MRASAPGEALNRHGDDTAVIRKVTVDQSAAWLAAGWADILRAPGVSFAHGAAVVAAGYVLALGLMWLGLGSLILPLGAGFVLLGPLVAVGLYEVSRRLERGEPVTLADALAAWRRNPSQIAFFGVGLMIAFFAWFELSLLLFALFFQGTPLSFDTFVLDVLTAPAAIPFLVIGTAMGGAIAAAVFALSVVALPMLLDREVSAGTAALTSLEAVRANWQVMVGWAAMIAVITGVGLATFFLGLVVAFPLVAHASWHAYRAMVD